MQSSEIELRKHRASVVMKRICLSSHYVVFCLFVCFLFFCCFSIVGVRKLQLSCSTATVKYFFCAFLNYGTVGSLASFVPFNFSTAEAVIWHKCFKFACGSTITVLSLAIVRFFHFFDCGFKGAVFYSSEALLEFSAIRLRE